MLDLWVMTFPVGKHWQCVCCHCACAVSHDLCVGANFSNMLEIPDPICLSLCDIYGSTIRIKWVIRQNNVVPGVKGHNYVCACAKSRVLALRGQKQLHIWTLRSKFAYATFMGLRWRLRAVYRWAGLMLRPFLGENLLSPVENGPQSPKWRLFGKV